MKLIECVPNFSEGRDLAVVDEIRSRIAAVPDVSVLHVTADASHNRSVITFVAPADVMEHAAFEAIRAARDLIDLTSHSGVHPRIGAADVVPFIPLDGATMDDCVMIARSLGQRVGTELQIPVYLYERAATRPSGRNLAHLRRGGFEQLAREIETEPERAPDFGPLRVHPTFGAVAIGARPFLVAFNAYIGGAERLGVAKEIARAVRESSGGLPCVRALGLEVDGQAQVSMNLVDIERTPLSVAFDAVGREAHARGAEVTWSEIIGLVPESVVAEVAGSTLRLRDSLADHVLERRMLETRGKEQSLSGYLESVAGPDPVPGGGSVAAIVGALAAALTRMVAQLTTKRPRYATVRPEMRDIAERAQRAMRELEKLATEDTEAYARVVDARRLPSRTAEEIEQRERAVTAALRDATLVPLRVATIASEITRLAEIVAQRGNKHAITDAGIAALLASTACIAAVYNVRVNAKSLGRGDAQDSQVLTAMRFQRAAFAGAARVAAFVDAALDSSVGLEGR